MGFERRDFFISYARSDQDWAEWIAWQLEGAGYSVFLAAWDIKVGSNFVLEMQRAQQDCDRIIAVLSPDYLSLDFTLTEWAAAFLADDTRGYGRRLIPVRVRPCRPTGIFRSLVSLDLIDEDEGAAAVTLLGSIGRLTGRTRTRLPGPRPHARFPGEASPRAVQAAARPTALIAPSAEDVPAPRPPLFFAFAEEDGKDALARCRLFLAQALRQKLLRIWHPGDTPPGEDPEEAAGRILTEAQVLLIFVTPLLLALEHEALQRAEERYRDGSARVIPILVDPVPLDPVWLKNLVALPRDRPAISLLPRSADRDLAWTEIAKALTSLARTLPHR